MHLISWYSEGRAQTGVRTGPDSLDTPPDPTSTTSPRASNLGYMFQPLGETGKCVANISNTISYFTKCFTEPSLSISTSRKVDCKLQEASHKTLTFDFHFITPLRKVDCKLQEASHKTLTFDFHPICRLRKSIVNCRKRLTKHSLSILPPLGRYNI